MKIGIFIFEILAGKLAVLLLYKNSIDTQGKLRLNLHSLSVSELLEYRRNIEHFLVKQLNE
jgi:hypothetical protein